LWLKREVGKQLTSAYWCVSFFCRCAEVATIAVRF
jgi:hypothetical protein